MTQPWVLIPAKGFDRAKSRLSPVVSAAERALLARQMFERVVAAARGCPGVEGVLVTTDDPMVSGIAKGLGVDVLADRGSGLREVIDAGLTVLRERRIGAAVVVMADLPEVVGDDLTALLRLLDEAPMVLAPDQEGEGTNALALRPIDALARTWFGQVGSFGAHMAAARRSGLDVRVCRRRGLAFDLDRAHQVGRTSRAQ